MNMKRVLLVLGGWAMVVGSANAQEALPQTKARILPSSSSSGPSPAATKDQRDLAGYAIGYDFAARLRSEGADLNPETLLRGIKDALTDGKPAFTPQQLQAAMDAFNKEMQARAEVRFKAASEKNKRDGALFLSANKLKSGVKISQSGLQVQILKSGTGKTPTAKDRIKANYHGTLIDGTVFDSTLESNMPLEISMEEVIDGWKEALLVMKAGDKWRLFVPSALAYGEQGFGPVPPNAVLIFDLELLEVKAPEAKSLAPIK